MMLIFKWGFKDYFKKQDYFKKEGQFYNVYCLLKKLLELLCIQCQKR